MDINTEIVNKNIVNDFFNNTGIVENLNYNAKGDRGINFKTKLAHINHARWLVGRPPIDNVYCNKCKAKNSHFTADCPTIVCYICKGSHNTRYCPKKKECQFCGGTDHITQMCKNEEAIKFRQRQISYCSICRKKGHIAKFCKTNLNNYKNNFKNYNYNYNYYWKKNNQWNKFRNYFNNYNYNFRKRNNSYNYFRRRYF